MRSELMITFRTLPVCLAFALALLPAEPAESAARKCRATPNGLPVANTQPLLVLDGRIVGPLAGGSSAARLDRVAVNDSTSMPVEEVLDGDVLRIDIVCLEMTEEGRQVGRAVIAVTTRAGAVEFMHAHLRALAELQDEHHARTGTYAGSLADLAFFTSRAPLPIRLTAHPDGWEARVELEGVVESCRIEGGSRSSGKPDRPLNVVRCESA
jgi:hypothetical protein